MDINTGKLDSQFIESPNFDDRPENTDPELIVIHNISLPPNEFGGPWITALFCNNLDPEAHPYFKDIYQMRVSSHVLIRRNGEIIQFVPFHKRAWHAGQSYYNGRGQCNNFSIGIELEGSDQQAFEPPQYQQLSKLAHLLINSYPTLSDQHITGHSDIAPGRKTDPGPFFDWTKFSQLLTKL
ncbi:MAG: 1,6-anhydro-N-acetylmuramyl-L-alanine amidase AmpD [Thiohalomonadales bacterium]